MLYYSIPVLHGILEDPYFTHYCLLVAAMHLMLGSSVSEKDIKQAESYLHRFYVMLPTLYGKYFIESEHTSMTIVSFRRKCLHDECAHARTHSRLCKELGDPCGLIPAFLSSP